MFGQVRAAALAAVSTLVIGGGLAGGAQANILSLLPGSCANQPESQPFTQWGDYNEYTPVPGGSFESGSVPWLLSGGAGTVAGNETFYVRSPTDSRSLALPAGSSATSPASCTDIYHPTLRLFVRNTGSSRSHLTVDALYPGLLGSVQSSQIGSLTGSGSWEPTPQLSLLLDNLLGTLSLDQTAIAFRFAPAGSLGNWRIDDVYLDPFARG
jgi:hypothetical protein